MPIGVSYLIPAIGAQTRGTQPSERSRVTRDQPGVSSHLGWKAALEAHRDLGAKSRSSTREPGASEIGEVDPRRAVYGDQLLS